MLVVSKLEAGQLNLKVNPQNLLALAGKVVADHRVDSDGLAVQINLMASPEPSTVSLDGQLTRTPKFRWLGCVKLLAQKYFWKIAGLPAVVW